MTAPTTGPLKLTADRLFGTCDVLGCDKDCFEESLDTGVQLCAKHADDPSMWRIGEAERTTPTTGPTLEKIARVICERVFSETPQYIQGEWDANRADWIADARAALEALREPSDKVIEIGSDDGCCRECAETAWGKQIAAILSGDA